MNHQDELTPFWVATVVRLGFISRSERSVKLCHQSVLEGLQIFTLSFTDKVRSKRKTLRQYGVCKKNCSFSCQQN